MAREMGMVERMVQQMSEKTIFALIYLLASIALGVMVQMEFYGGAAALAMMIMVDVVSGLQKEEETKWR